MVDEQKEQKKEVFIIREKKEQEDQEEQQAEQQPYEQGLKEQRIRKIAMLYYSRQDIRKNMLEFSKNRECVPRYFEGFGKRPDSFQYESDIIEYAKNGATSFHCSEEIWRDPMELITGMPEAELKKLRTGWDLLIDIDCKYLEYSKKAAHSIIRALRAAGVNNVGVKFSGGKGFHLIVPFKAFPEEMSGKKTSEMFPEWPRRICAYLKEKSRVFLEEEMLSEDAKSLASFSRGMICETCKNLSQEKEKILYVCPGCKTEIENLLDNFKRKRIIRCPKCEKEMLESSRSKFYLCTICNKNSKTYPNNFKIEKEDIFQILGLDVILVSPRHLFRMPYSLHEKTALASVVLNPEEIKNFDMIKDANPMRVIPRNFMPNSQPEEAKRLLIESLEYKLPEENAVKTKAYKDVQTEFNKDGTEKRQVDNKDKKFDDIDYSRVREEHYPPAIKTILAGMKSDGKKRALFILLSFFKSLRMNDQEIQQKVEEWNKKNSEPLHPSYIKGQLMWYTKSKQVKLPPNFDKPYYRDIGIQPTDEELKAKNPLSYAVRKSFTGSGFKKKDKK